MLSRIICKKAGILPDGKGRFPDLKDPINYIQLFELKINPFYPTLGSLVQESANKTIGTRAEFLGELSKLLDLDVLVVRSIKEKLQDCSWHFNI